MVLSVIAISDRVLPRRHKRGPGRTTRDFFGCAWLPIPTLASQTQLLFRLVGWSKTLAREEARNGITVNTIVPGRIATGRIRFLDEQKAKREGRTVEEVSTESTGSIPLGRYGEPDEYASAVVFLASARAAYITGTILRVDGGLIASI